MTDVSYKQYTIWFNSREGGISGRIFFTRGKFREILIFPGNSSHKWSGYRQRGQVQKKSTFAIFSQSGAYVITHVYCVLCKLHFGKSNFLIRANTEWSKSAPPTHRPPNSSPAQLIARPTHRPPNLSHAQLIARPSHRRTNSSPVYFLKF